MKMLTGKNLIAEAKHQTRRCPSSFEAAARPQDFLVRGMTCPPNPSRRRASAAVRIAGWWSPVPPLLWLSCNYPLDNAD
jgi:hypothetical protein